MNPEEELTPSQADQAAKEAIAMQALQDEKDDAKQQAEVDQITNAYGVPGGRSPLAAIAEHEVIKTAQEELAGQHSIGLTGWLWVAAGMLNLAASTYDWIKLPSAVRASIASTTDVHAFLASIWFIGSWIVLALVVWFARKD